MKKLRKNTKVIFQGQVYFATQVFEGKVQLKTFNGQVWTSVWVDPFEIKFA